MKLNERGALVAFSHMCELNDLILDLLSRNVLISKYMRGYFCILKRTNAYDQVSNLLNIVHIYLFVISHLFLFKNTEYGKRISLFM